VGFTGKFSGLPDLVCSADLSLDAYRKMGPEGRWDDTSGGRWALVRSEGLSNERIKELQGPVSKAGKGVIRWGRTEGSDLLITGT